MIESVRTKRNSSFDLTYGTQLADPRARAAIASLAVPLPRKWDGHLNPKVMSRILGYTRIQDIGTRCAV